MKFLTKFSNFVPDFCVFLVLFVSEILGAKILIVHPLYSGSHVLTLRSVAESLTQRGHHVHILRWRDMHSFPAVNNGNITETLLSMNNEHGYWKFLSQEKQAAFKVLIAVQFRL